MSISARYPVRGMICRNCVDLVTEAVTGLDGVDQVSVDLPSGTVTVTSTAPIDPQRLAAAVQDAGYQLDPAG